MFTWIDGNSSVGADNVASRACRMATNAASVTPPRRWMLLLALLAHRGFPGVVVATRRLVVVAHEQPRVVGQLQQPLDRTIELVCVAAREIGARSAVVRHEQRVADEHGVANLVGQVRRRMARRVQDLDDEFPNAERFAVREQAVKIAAVGPQVFGVEHGPEDSLHVLDVLADADPRAGFGFDVRRA